MKYLLIFISVLATGAFAQGYNYTDDWDDTKSLDALLAVQIPLRVYDVTDTEIIGAAVDVSIRNNWKIEAYSKRSIIASYKRSRIEISFDENYLTIKEVPLFSEPAEGWLRSLHKHIEDRIKYYHYMRKISAEN
ncbi:MAG: hypothetical protein AB2606_19965 [Candidatus Thiodiazotropha taylori]